MEQENNNRRFSLEDDFMKTRTDTQLYGFMRCLSTAIPNGNDKWKEYLLKSTFTKNKKIIMDVCGIGSARTYKRHLDDLAKAGLIEEGSIRVKDKDYFCYFFPFDYDGNYKLIDKELLKIIVGCFSSLTIKIYLYLLNCSTAKDNYEFTVKELKEAFGYSSTTKTCDVLITDGLKVLKELKILDYEERMKEYLDSNGSPQSKPIKVLKFVALKCPKNLSTS